MQYFIANVIYPNSERANVKTIAAENIRSAINSFCNYYELDKDLNGAMQEQVLPFGQCLDFFKFPNKDNCEEIILSIYPIDYTDLISD